MSVLEYLLSIRNVVQCLINVCATTLCFIAQINGATTCTVACDYDIVLGLCSISMCHTTFSVFPCQEIYNVH